MTVTVSMTFNSLDEALAFMTRPVKLTEADSIADRDGTPRPDNPTTSATEKQGNVKAAKTDAPTPKAAASKPTAAEKKASAEPAAASKTETEPSAPDYTSVGAAIAAAVAAGKRTEVVATLGKFGAKSGKELKTEQYADFMVALTDATGEEPLG